MPFAEYAKYDGLGLAELVRSKHVTPLELVDEAIRRIEAHNPKLNAVIYKTYDNARQAALGKFLDGLFGGVPFLLKDIVSTLAGTPASAANRLRTARPMKALGLVGVIAEKTFEFIPYVPAFNVTGQPAMSVPLHWNDAGLPIGMHFAGRFGDEATLYRLAGQLERAKPWFDRAPPGF